MDYTYIKKNYFLVVFLRDSLENLKFKSEILAETPQAKCKE